MNFILLVVYCVLVTCIPFTHGRQQIDARAEMNKIAEKFEKLGKLSPEFIEGYIEQIQDSCRTNRTIEPEPLMNRTLVCMSKLFNQTAITAQMEAAIPNGELDDVFRSICHKWRSAKFCFKETLDYVEECWEEGDKMTIAVDTFVEFFCEKDNNGGRIALFIVYGGLTCLESKGHLVRKCLNYHMIDGESQEVCTSISQIHECLTHLRKCKDVTPENIVSSVVKEIEKAMKCPPSKMNLVENNSVASLFQYQISTLSCIFLISFVSLI